MHGTAPRVSILMSFLDEARFIREAVESARAQTFRAWELLLIDDGSTDGSSEIARDYAHRWPGQIVYLRIYYPLGDSQMFRALRVPN